jgi:hypothetical protein
MVSTSLCKGKRVSNPNKCKKMTGCKVAKGTKRTFCRKTHNHTKKRRASKKSKTSTENRALHNRRLSRALQKLH